MAGGVTVVSITSVLLLFVVSHIQAGQVKFGNADLAATFQDSAKTNSFVITNFFKQAGTIDRITFAGGKRVFPAFAVARRVQDPEFDGYVITALYALAIGSGSKTSLTTASNLLEGSAEVEAGSALIYVPFRDVSTGGVPYNKGNELECGETFKFDFRNWAEQKSFPYFALLKEDMCRTYAVEAIVNT